jgi:hypothetical protein
MWSEPEMRAPFRGWAWHILPGGHQARHLTSAMSSPCGPIGKLDVGNMVISGGHWGSRTGK